MTRRTRAVLDASIAVVLTATIMTALNLLVSAMGTLAMGTPPPVGVRIWWFLVWGAAVIATSAVLARHPTGVRHLACLAVSLAITILHLGAAALGVVPADITNRGHVLLDFVFLGAAIASLTVVSIRRREFREIDHD